MRRCAMRALLLLVSAMTPDAFAARFDEIDVSVNALVARHALPGAVLMLAQDGVIVHQQAYGGYALETRVPIASASKWMSAAVLARLVDQGRLRWDDPMVKFLPDAPADKAQITIRQLFALTSGIPGGDVASGSPCLADRNIAFEACAREILALPLTDAPGSVFDYGGNSMQVAGYLAERATGQTFSQLFRDEIGVPLGLAATGYSFFPDVDPANPRIAGGMFSTAPDYMKLLLLLQAQGKAGGQRLLDSATVTEMDRDQTRGTRVVSTPMPGARYGIGHWVDLVDADGHSLRVSSPGAFGFTPWIDLRRDIAGVLLVYGDYSRMRADTVALIEQVARVLDKNTDAVPFADFGGIWWRPQESGSGINLLQRADHQLTGSFYGYDDTGANLWLVIGGGQWVSASRWQGKLYRSTYAGSGALSTGVIPGQVSTTEFGAITFDFADPTHAEVHLQYPAAERHIAIERFPF